MSTPRLVFGPINSLAPAERKTLQRLWRRAETCAHPKRTDFLRRLVDGVTRIEKLGEALESYPPIFEERRLGHRERNLATLVDHLAQADDSNYEMYLPTRALVGRTLVMAELNFWRMTLYIVNEIAAQGSGEDDSELGGLRGQVDEWLHGCVYTLLAEEVLGAIARDTAHPVVLRSRAVERLAGLWGNYLHWNVREFFPLLQATWSARNRIRVSVGTMLGVSEMMRLLQAGCDPEFVGYFTRPNPTRDEARAFQEFLIGVPTETIRSLEHLMEEQGKTSLSPEETEAVLGRRAPLRHDGSHLGVRAYRFFRERQLQAAARRLRDEPGPRRTAEEYVMIYFLERECAAAGGA